MYLDLELVLFCMLYISASSRPPWVFISSTLTSEEVDEKMRWRDRGAKKGGEWQLDENEREKKWMKRQMEWQMSDRIAKGVKWSDLNVPVSC